jgi:hypothetical protein
MREVLFSRTLRPTVEELNRYKFSGVTLGGLVDLPDQLISLEQLFTTSLLLPRGTQVVAYSGWTAGSADQSGEDIPFHHIVLRAAWYTKVYTGCAAGSADQSRTAVHRLTPSIWYTVSSFLDSLRLFIFYNISLLLSRGAQSAAF